MKSLLTVDNPITDEVNNFKMDSYNFLHIYVIEVVWEVVQVMFLWCNKR